MFGMKLSGGDVRYLTAEEMINTLVDTHGTLSDAIDYSMDAYGSGFIYLGSGTCDSSVSSAFKMQFVKRAQDEFLRNNRKEILNRAAELVAQDLSTLGVTV